MSRVGVYRETLMRWLACMRVLRGCGTAWRSASEYLISRGREELEELSDPSPSRYRLSLSPPLPPHPLNPRAISPDIMVHTWHYTHAQVPPPLLHPCVPSFSSPIILPPASPSTDRPARHHHSYNSARCKLHNLVTVSPGIVLSRTIPLS